MPISAIWILAIIEVLSTAVVGWKIVVGRSYSALDVAQCFATAMRPWEPRLLIVPDLQYVPSASMPSNLDMTTPPPMGRLTAMDNAKAHKAKLPLAAWLNAHYGVLNFGLPHVPEARPHIEQFFHRLEVGAFRRLPGGFTPHRVNQPAISTSAWSSNDHPVHLQALEDLLDVVITGHNVSPLPARQNRTPLEILSSYQNGSDYWIAPPYNEGNAKALTTTCHRVTIKGSKSSNKPVRVQFLQVDYRHPDLDKAWEMVGQSYQAMIDYEDLRTITLVDDSLRPVRTLYAAPPSYLRMGGYFELEEKTASMARYADAMGEALLLHMQPLIEKEVGFSLIPAYSYLRFYTAESFLRKHVDRPSCEISATLTVGNKSTASWPIYVESNGKTIAVDLDVGDLMIYKGPKIPHWREKLADGYWLQVFLHYVKSEGDFVDYGFDKRPSIGPWQGELNHL